MSGDVMMLRAVIAGDYNCLSFQTDEKTIKEIKTSAYLIENEKSS